MAKAAEKTNKYGIAELVCFVLMAIGIGLRLFVYLQNRNLIIDEANVARNVSERTFLQFLEPLSYEQFAPPVFLWITKLSTRLFGMSELSLRLYPLLCGILSVWLFYKLLRKLIPAPAVWYPLALFVFTAFLVRYSTELKQYMPDVFITLLLIWFTLKNDVLAMLPKHFFLFWTVAGSIVVWGSMPGVFILACLWTYYCIILLRARSYKMIAAMVLMGLVWFAQFILYYFMVLKAQIEGDFLHNSHMQYFLFGTPGKIEEWQHNWYVFSALMRHFEGLYPYVHDINTAFLIAGAIMLLRNSLPKFILIVGPVLLLCIAAALDQFTLMPRVALFIMPVLITIVGYGYAQVFLSRRKVVTICVTIVALYATVCAVLRYREDPFKYEELTEGMQYMKDRKITSAAISVYHSSVPAFIYYTTMHPGKDNWASIKDADRLAWYHHYDSIGWQMRYVWSSRQPLGFLYTNCTEAEFKKRNDAIAKYMQLVEKMDKPYIKAYIYIKPVQ